jgi:hypothetical protein
VPKKREIVRTSKSNNLRIIDPCQNKDSRFKGLRGESMIALNNPTSNNKETSAVRGMP